MISPCARSPNRGRVRTSSVHDLPGTRTMVTARKQTSTACSSSTAFSASDYCAPTPPSKIKGCGESLCVDAMRRGHCARLVHAYPRGPRRRRKAYMKEPPTEAALHINTIASPIPTRVYKPATVTPRQTSAMTLSDWNLICLPSTAYSRCHCPSPNNFTREPGNRSGCDT